LLPEDAPGEGAVDFGSIETVGDLWVAEVLDHASDPEPMCRLFVDHGLPDCRRYVGLRSPPLQADGSGEPVIEETYKKEMVLMFDLGNEPYRSQRCKDPFVSRSCDFFGAHMSNLRTRPGGHAELKPCRLCFVCPSQFGRQRYLKVNA
jgi:hypothetical protein